MKIKIWNEYIFCFQYKFCWSQWIIWISLFQPSNNYSVIINGKNFYYQTVDSDIKWYEEMRKLTTSQDEDYSTECLLHDDYIKNQYR